MPPKYAINKRNVALWVHLFPEFFLAPCEAVSQKSPLRMLKVRGFSHSNKPVQDRACGVKPSFSGPTHSSPVFFGTATKLRLSSVTARGQKSNTNFFFQFFRAPPGYPAKKAWFCENRWVIVNFQFRDGSDGVVCPLLSCHPGLHYHCRCLSLSLSIVDGHDDCCLLVDAHTFVLSSAWAMMVVPSWCSR